MATNHLNKLDFLKKITNYEQHPGEWHFLGEKPALIDFHATWCGPCKALGPVLEELSEEYADKIDIYKIDVDEEYEVASMYGIRSVPTLIFAPMQGVPHMAQGAMPKADLKEAIDSILLSK